MRLYFMAARKNKGRTREDEGGAAREDEGERRGKCEKCARKTARGAV